MGVVEGTRYHQTKAVVYLTDVFQMQIKSGNSSCEAFSSFVIGMCLGKRGFFNIFKNDRTC